MVNKIIKPDQTIDVKGLTCPLPVKKATMAMEHLKSGQILEIITTDPEANLDIPAWAYKNGYEIIKVIDDWLILKYYIKKV